MPKHDGFRYLVFHERAVDDSGEVSLFGGKTRVEVIDPNDPNERIVVAVGESVCHPKLDQFNRFRGRQIALGRALKNLERGEPVVPRGCTGWMVVRDGIEHDGPCPVHESPVDAAAVDWFDLALRDLDRLMAFAFREADREGFCYVHFHDKGPPRFIVLTPERYDSIVERIFPDGDGIPEGDPEWSHSHATPEMAEEEPAREKPSDGFGPFR